MSMSFRKYFWIAVLVVTAALCVPALAQYQQAPQEQPRQHDQDDRNRGDDQNRAIRDNGNYNQTDRDRDDQNRASRDYDRNEHWRNTKAYKEGFKDGGHDRSHRKGENVSRHHWKNDQDRQAYEAGYYAAYRGNQPGHDRDDQRRDHDEHR
jgi:hypothetical protein